MLVLFFAAGQLIGLAFRAELTIRGVALTKGDCGWKRAVLASRAREWDRQKGKAMWILKFGEVVALYGEPTPQKRFGVVRFLSKSDSFSRFLLKESIYVQHIL